MVERRRRQRVPLSNPLFSTVRAAEPARVVDLSVHGLQVEVFVPLRPATECPLSLPTSAGVLRVRARVQRCRAMLSAGNGRLSYRAGLEFVALQPGQVEAIEDVIVDLCLSEVGRGAGLPRLGFRDGSTAPGNGVGGW